MPTATTGETRDRDLVVYLGFGLAFTALGATMLALTGGTGTIATFTALENAIGALTTYIATGAGLACLWRAWHGPVRGERAREPNPDGNPPCPTPASAPTTPASAG